ncbi:MAG: ABC transporter substrate-binding protein, partial [Alphaproteobacteria bacterium]|nr:ABC transporter substrate-binding protein [Alphaproteobacteria bacterium]
RHFGRAAEAYAEAASAAFGGRVEIVHNQSYDPAAASDMLGLLTPVAAAQPDMLFQMGLVPAQQAQLVETMNQLGFTGVFAGEQWILPYILQRNSGQSIAGRLYGAFTVEAAEPTFSPRAHDFYQRYLKKFGEKEWTTDASATYCALGTVEVGLAAAPSIDAAAVMDALYKMETVNHPVFGASKWGGQDIFGANHHLLTPLPIYNTDASGAFTVDGVVDPAAWWAANGAAALPKLEAGGQVFKG